MRKFNSPCPTSATKVSDVGHDRLEWGAERAVMIDTKKEMIRAEIAEADGRDVPVGVVFSMIHEIDRLAEDVERLHEALEAALEAGRTGDDTE